MLLIPFDGLVHDVHEAVRAEVFQPFPAVSAIEARDLLRVKRRRPAEAITRMATHVDVEFAPLGLRADAEVLNGSSDDAHGVALEMGQRDEDVGRGDGGGNESFLEDVPFRKVDPVIVGPHESIGADERAPQNGGTVSVALGRGGEVQFGDAAGVGAVRQRRGVAHEGSSAQALDPVHQGPSVHGAQIAGVVPLSAVGLDSHHVLRLDQLVETGRVEHGQQLGHQARLERCAPGIHVIHSGSHGPSCRLARSPGSLFRPSDRHDEPHPL